MTWELTMAMMLAVTGGAAMYVAWPLLSGQTRPEEFFGNGPEEPVLQRLLFQRDTTYAAMKELEFDRAMGNLSEEDFEQLQERYKRKALAILKRIDDAKAGRLPAWAEAEDEAELGEYEEPLHARTERRGGRAVAPAIDLDVEQEIEAFRRKSRELVASSRPASRTTARPTASPSCPSCGRPVRDPDAAFCSKCGAPLRRRGPGAPDQRSGPRDRKTS